jgi:hypothetical protein
MTGICAIPFVRCVAIAQQQPEAITRETWDEFTFFLRFFATWRQRKTPPSPLI